MIEIPEEKSELSVGELARRSGVAVSALHFYETKGLIPSWRTAGDQRRFPKGALRLVSLIKVAQKLGFSLEEIKKTFDLLPRGGPPSQADWRRMATVWQKEMSVRIEEMTKLRDSLTSCIGCGCLSLKDCPLRNPGDKLGRAGPGPRLLMR
ncbi:MAG: redox-sensitive transcriptional activator SoxR [Proteobacteria bacterium]|nr:MAG: redox-sensitive transcriptional activator SoxR [Pseudomonadota bacterium]